MCRFVEKAENGKISPLVTSGDLIFGLTNKLTKVFPSIVDDRSIAAYRGSLRGPRAELEGVRDPPSQHDMENTGHQHSTE